MVFVVFIDFLPDCPSLVRSPNPYPVELDLVRDSDLLLELPFYFAGSSGLVIGALAVPVIFAAE